MSRDLSSDALLQELADREAIRDLACRYAHHVWQRQVAPAVELFTEDGEMDTGRPAGAPGPRRTARGLRAHAGRRPLPALRLEPRHLAGRG